MKRILLIFLFSAIAAAHEEANPPLLQPLVHSLGLSEDVFVIGGTAVILFLVWLWRRA